MRTDPILEELYAVRRQMVQQAGGDYVKLFADLKLKHSANPATQPGVVWVDFSKATGAAARTKVAASA